MAKHALDPAYRRMSVEEFLALDLGDAKAELEDGQIRMMAGGNEAHARIAANVLVALKVRLRGTGCRPYGSDLAVRTEFGTIRFPDVSVYCDVPADPANDSRQLLGDPRMVVEVLSPSTRSHDQRAKFDEYRQLHGLREILFVDPGGERVRLVSRSVSDGWSGEWRDDPQDVDIPSLGITIPHAEIFARD